MPNREIEPQGTPRPDTRRDAIISALHKSLEVFVSHSEDSFDDIMTNGLWPVANVLEMDFIIVYQLTETGGVSKIGQVYRWEGAKGGTTPLNEKMKTLLEHRVVAKWVEIFSKNECRLLQYSTMEEDELDFLSRFGIKTIFLAPVFTNGKLWGTVAFQDHVRERTIDQDCIDLMCSAARMCVSALIREGMAHETEDAFKALSRREVFTGTLNKMAVTFLSYSEGTFETMMDAGVRLVADMAGLDRLSVWRNVQKPDGLHSSQIYRWDRASGGTTIPTPGLEDMTYARFAPRWVEVFSRGESIHGPVPMLPEKGMLQSFGVMSAFATPVFIDNSFWGFVLYEDRRTERYFDGDSIEMMRSAAFLCANTVIRAELARDITEADRLMKIRLKQQEALSEISRGFLVSGDSEALVNEALERLGRYQRVSLTIVFSADYQRHAADPAYYWADDGKMPPIVSLDLFGFITGNFPQTLPENTGVPIIACPDVAAHPSKDVLRLLEADVHAFLCAPLYVEGRLWGILSAEQYHTPREWSENEKEFASMTASMIAGAIARDIYNTKLNDALRKANAASKAKSDFLSNMSHEMRTPLNAVIGMSTIGRDTADTERKNYTLDKIQDASTHLLGVINDVLDMSKIEENKLELSLIEFDFERMLQKAITVINFHANEKKHRFSISVDADVPHFIVGDDQRLAQIITNLLSNAVKFTPVGGMIRLAVSLAGEEDGVCELRAEVADSGIGISPEQQERLFHAFGQADSGTSRKFGGTGLGLAISKRIVELMDGEIHIESELGKGARFIFTIKARRGNKTLRSFLAGSVKWDVIRVLAVDADDGTRRYIQDTLSRLGIVCDTAGDVFEACRTIDERGRYDIYFIDWRMMGPEGYQMLKRIRWSKKDRSPLVTVISTGDWVTYEEEAAESGADKYLLKPLFSFAIIDCLNECLAKDGGKQESALKKDNTFAGRQILLVEDMEINREVLIALLSGTELLIDTAENGQLALDMIAASPDKYDLVFMDVQMPQMDGFAATRRIRELPGRPRGRLPIVAMTAHVFMDDIEKCLAAGMDDHVSKPLNLTEIYEKLHKYLH